MCSERPCFPFYAQNPTAWLEQEKEFNKEVVRKASRPVQRK